MVVYVWLGSVPLSSGASSLRKPSSSKPALHLQDVASQQLVHGRVQLPGRSGVGVREREPLGLEHEDAVQRGIQRGLEARQRVLRPLLVIDVRRHGDDAHQPPVLVPLGHRARQVPAPHAVLAPHAELALRPHALVHGRFPHVPHLLALRGVHILQEDVQRQLSTLAPGVRLPHLVGVVHRPVRARRPHALGQRVQQPAVAQLVLALQRLALPLAQQRRLALELLLLEEQVHEDADLGAEDLRIERLEQVVHRAVRVALEDVGRVPAERGEEDDGDGAGALALLDERRRLEAIQPRHLHVHEDDGEVTLEEELQGLLAAGGAHQLLPERLEDGLERQEVRRVVIHHEDAGPLARRALWDTFGGGFGGNHAEQNGGPGGYRQ